MSITNNTLIQPFSFVAMKENIAWQFNPDKIFLIPNAEDRLSHNDLEIGPIACEIHPTSKCNLECSHCSYISRNKKIAFLSVNTVSGILKWCIDKGVSGILFSGGGDPLSWPHWVSFYEMLEQQNNVGPNISLATNAVLLNKVFKDLGLSPFHTIQVSIYGYDAASFLKMTGRNQFDKFLTSLDFLFNSSVKNLQCTGKIVIDNKSISHWRKILKFSLNWPFDAIVLKIAGAFEGPHGLSIPIDQRLNLHKELMEFDWASYLKLKYSSLANILLPSKDFMPCHTISMGLYLLIRSDGSLYPCVAGADDVNNCLGSLDDKTIGKIWGSKRHQKVVKSLFPANKRHNCRIEVCRHNAYNYLLERQPSFSALRENVSLQML